MGSSSDPVEIRELNDAQLRITWSDGHVSTYRYDWLRSVCPCALCRSRKQQGGIEGLLGEMVRPDIKPRDIETVGRYALQFTWSDGHDEGIFTYEMLRQGCPCQECDANLHTA